jgi:chromosome segregation ATPase
MDKEWAARQKMRQDETTAVSEAVKIMTEDDARDLTSKTTGAVLLQASMQKQSRKTGREAAFKVLRDAALKFNKPKLMMLAASMRDGGVFDKMKKNIQDMIAKLTKDGKDEIKFRDYCIEELHQTGLQLDDTYHTKANLDTKYADLESTIKRLTDEIEAAKASNAEMQIEMKKAAETREQESQEYEGVIADQRATVEILTKAVRHLQAFYDRKAALLQVSSGKAGQAPPPGFQPYVKAGGGGVVAMINNIIADSKHCIKMSYSDNHQAQMAYEEFMRDMNKVIHAQFKQITDQTQERAEADADMARTKEDLVQNLKDLEAVDSKSNAVHTECDFVLKNFEMRQKNLSNEIDALYEAIAMMSQAA